MAEDKFNANTKSPRYTTTKALGFRGGALGAGGNLQQPTYQETAGVQTKPPSTSAPAIADYTPPAAAAAPEAPSLTQQALTGAALAAGGEVLKEGVRRGIGKIFGGRDAEGGAGPAGRSGGDTEGGDYQSSPQFEADYDFGGYDAGGGGGDYLSSDNFSADYDFGDAGGSFGDAAGGFGDTGDYLSSANFAADYDFGDVAGDVGFGGVPVVGPAISLISGHPEKAAGQLIGGAVGSAFGPIGTAVGSAVGGFVSNHCFISEAVYSSGGQDNAEELQVLRWFRDNVMLSTPQGQQMVQEYEQMAPMVVQAVASRPDAMQIFQQIKSEFLDQAVQAIKSGNFKAALEIYSQMINFVQPFASEMLEGEVGEDLDDAGNTAAIAGQDDLTTSGIAEGQGDADFGPPGATMGGAPGMQGMPPGGMQPGMAGAPGMMMNGPQAMPMMNAHMNAQQAMPMPPTPGGPGQMPIAGFRLGPRRY